MSNYEEEIAKRDARIEEQAREIDLLWSDRRRDADVIRKLRPGMTGDYDLDAWLNWTAEAEELRAELAALKAQPSGVVLPERMEKTETSSDEYDMCADTHNACLEEVARLNSPPVGAGVADERAAFEAWRIDQFCGGEERLKKCSNAPDIYYYTAEQEAWRVWQARAALTAKSDHSARSLNGDDWGVFASYLLDKCEGEIIYEEHLQRWLADMVSDPHYGALFRREKSNQPDHGAKSCVRFGEGNPHWPCKIHTVVSAGETWPQQQCPVTGQVTDVDPADMGYSAEEIAEWCKARAELSRLKVGQGEAVARVGVVPGTDFKSLDFSVELQDLPVGTKLYTSPPSDPGTVPVRRELLEQILVGRLGMHYKAAKHELRALLASHEQQENGNEQ